ncbi:hypothetical protein GWK47_003304 [Chionoecetes opilio]|uniref:Uncharacterized protein n=1 Tax=Chionoecetes opilio TaxID=41210 RepID=A0A8J4YL77_CHIOP|nr:hypothetical protein GWK47_003304 [Chionoecetes opilio]
MGAFTHPMFPACGGSSGGELSVNIREEEHTTTSSASLEKLRQWCTVPDLTEAPERMLRERACGRSRKCPQRGMVSAARRSGRNRTAKPLVEETSTSSTTWRTHTVHTPFTHFIIANVI